MKSLKQRLKEAAKAFILDCKRIRLTEKLLDVLRETSLWHDLGDDHITFTSWGWIVWLKITAKVDIQDVEDQFCAAIHQEYGCDWILEVYEEAVTLTCNPFDNQITFHIEILETSSCQIRKILKRILTDEELTDKRHEYEYFIDCGDDKIK